MNVDDQTILSLTAGQARIEQRLEDFDKRLLGGEGQPGALPLLYAEHKSLATRVDALEDSAIRSKGWLAGATAIITALGACIGSVATWIIHHAHSVVKQ